MWKYLPISAKTGCGNPDLSINSLGGPVSDSSRSLTGILFAWPSTVSVAEGLRRAGLLNTAPPTTVLMKECLIGYAAKTQTGGKSEGRPWGGGVIMHFLTMNGYVKCAKCSEMILANLIGIFWIVRPFIYESELGALKQAPAFWHCAEK